MARRRTRRNFDIDAAFEAQKPLTKAQYTALAMKQRRGEALSDLEMQKAQQFLYVWANRGGKKKRRNPGSRRARRNPGKKIGGLLGLAAVGGALWYLTKKA